MRKRQLKKKMKSIKKHNAEMLDACWNLDITLAEYILPRLIWFRKNAMGMPSNFVEGDDYNQVLDHMINAFALIIEDDYLLDEREDELNELTECGLQLFAEQFRGLWL